MNKFELKGVLKYFNVDDSQTTIEMKDNKPTEVFHFNGLNIHLEPDNFAVDGPAAIIEGKIPSEVVRTLRVKSPGNNYSIFPLGTNDDSVISENIKRNKYINQIDIYSYEGLIIFLLELSDYYNRKSAEKNGGLYIYPQLNYKEVIAEVTKHLIADMNPCITAYDWMQLDQENRSFYNEGVRRNRKNQSYTKLRIALNRFDSTINPFWVLGNKDLIDGIDFNNFLDNVVVSACTEYENNRAYCGYLFITDASDTDNATNYMRCSDGFSYELESRLDSENDDDNHIYVNHYYSTEESETAGENLTIIYYSSDRTPIKKINVNLTSQKIEIITGRGDLDVTYSSNRKKTEEIINWIVEQLQIASNYAKKVTTANLTGNGTQRKREMN